MRTALLVAMLVLGACATRGPADGPPRRPATLPPAVPGEPRQEPRSRYGNPAHYEVYGKRYFVMDSAAGYQERGVASWYGSKFHGKRTSSGEPYDMYALSAAHKTLPLPTWVRVTHLGNGRSLVLRVNDRGPFVDNRIIDLSYAAAEALDMVGTGTALVEVQVIDTTGTSTATDTRTSSPPTQSAASTRSTTPLYLQTGAFSDARNADRQRQTLARAGVASVFVDPGASNDGSVTLYRVRIGPIADVAAFDAVQSQLGALGITDARLVSVE